MPSSDTSPSPISGDEVDQHLELVQQAMHAATPAELRAALGEGFLRFGLRFDTTLEYLATESGGVEPFGRLHREGKALFVKWLTGTRLSDRADEEERRARVILHEIGLGERIPELTRVVAHTILKLPAGHPLRDTAAVNAALLAHLDRVSRSRSDADVLYTLADLFDCGVQPEEWIREQIASGLAVVDRGRADVGSRREFLLRAFGYWLKRTIEARDRDDRPLKAECMQRARELLDRYPVTSADTRARKAMLEGVLLEEGGDPAAAAATFAAARARSTGARRHIMAYHAARLRMQLREYREVVAMLAPTISGLETAYLTAVDDAAVHEAGEAFARATLMLAFAYAHLREWPKALRALERGKSLRTRYRAALRQTPAAARLLALEEAMHALSRGLAPETSGVDRDAVVDFVGREVTARAKVLEAYRVGRPKLPRAMLAAPTTREIARSLGAAEAAVMLGTSGDGTLIVVVRPTDRDEPSGTLLLEQWPVGSLIPFFAGEDGKNDGWLYALGAPEARADPRRALDMLLEGIDRALGIPLRALLKRWPEIRRLRIVPHQWLHLVPFWTLRSLAGYDVVLAPSAAHLRQWWLWARRAPRAAVHEGAPLGEALVVADPTLTLPVAPAEADAVTAYLRAAGVPVRRLLRQEGTEQAVASALEEATLFHYCGHGRGNLDQPMDSALFLYPDLARVPHGTEPGDLLSRLAATVDQWREGAEYERFADIPGAGRLTERSVTGALEGELERRLHYAARGTLWGQYRDGGRVELAELWTAGDIMLQGTLATCRLAFLSACESGSGRLQIDVDEHAGLPAALHLAGANAVVCSLWPVGDEMAALYVDMFYEALAASLPIVDLAALVRRVGERLSAMSPEDAAARIELLRARTSDPVAAFRLEAFAADVRSRTARPFAHPYDWGAFHVTGAGTVTLAAEAVDAHGR